MQDEKPLEYEETPVIEPAAAEAPVGEPPPPPPPPVEPAVEAPKNAPAQKKNIGRRIIGTLGTLIVFAVLFATGVFLSGVIRDYLGSSGQTEIAVTPTPQPTVFVQPAGSATPSGTPAVIGWKSYSVISGVTRAAIPGISFSLPPEVSEPTCDGTSCSSQGAYLPGGTRFTVAPRGEGQVLKDFRGSIISDLRGQAFTVTQTTIAGRNAVSYEADFTGSTAGGSTFTRMRGVMIEVTTGLSLELNHFTPTGTTADFVSDDAVFTQILSRVSFSSTSSGAMTK